MNSIEFLSCIFQLVDDLKHVRTIRSSEDENLYSVNMIFDLGGEEDE